MKVFVVVGFLQMAKCDLSYDVIGVFTTLNKAQETMKQCHNNWADQVEVWEDCVIKDRFIDDDQCLLIYEHLKNEERRFVVIEEREVDNIKIK
jgi:hypothetical protein